MVTASPATWRHERGDVIWIPLNLPAGNTEMKDEHPMRVLTTAAFNGRPQIVSGFQ